MLTTVEAALGGAGALGGLLTPVLVHLTSRRLAVQTENASLIAELQEERDGVVRRLDQRDATLAALWDYVFRMRYWMAKGSEGEPPTMPDTLTLAAVRSAVAAVPTPR